MVACYWLGQQLVNSAPPYPEAESEYRYCCMLLYVLLISRRRPGATPAYSFTYSHVWPSLLQRDAVTIIAFCSRKSGSLTLVVGEFSSFCELRTLVLRLVLRFLARAGAGSPLHRKLGVSLWLYGRCWRKVQRSLWLIAMYFKATLSVSASNSRNCISGFTSSDNGPHFIDICVSKLMFPRSLFMLCAPKLKCI